MPSFRRFVGMKVFCFWPFGLKSSTPSSLHLVSDQQKCPLRNGAENGRTSMRKCSIRFGSLAMVCAVCVAPGVRAQYATSLISYNAGTGAASGYNQPSSALGMPSTFTNDPLLPGPVDPFDPPYLTEQIVSIGAGGSLTVQFGAPVRNDAANPYGLDFVVYGNAGFVYSDFNAGKKGGDLFGAATPGSTRVSVSADNVNYFTLDTSLAPTVDSYFPTD